MPECYTHSAIAAQALVRSGQVVASQQAFLAGANGPDVFSMYKAWAKNPQPNLSALGQTIHHVKTGEYLNALIHLATTPVQQSYTLGFLTHYVADCLFHPYITAMCQKGGPYDRPNGPEWLQSSLDSTLSYQNLKTYCVPLHAGTPVLITEELAQVTNLLHEAILRVYGQNIPIVALSDTFHNNLTMRRLLSSKLGVRRALVSLAAPLVFGKRDAETIRSRMQPAPPLKKLPDVWTNPYTGREYNITTEELITEAENGGATCMMAAMSYWLGNTNAAKLARTLGNNDYYTGQPLVEAQPE